MTTLAADLRVTRGAFALEAQFSVPLDGVSVLFGPSGAGKSVLLSALAGLVRAERGRVSLAGRALDDVAAHERGVGLVFQDARLFPHLSVRGNLTFAQKRAPTRRLSLEDAAARFDIAALLDRPVRNLSGGEKGRVALARALLAAPDLLLLDEPFAALDGARRYAFLAALREMHETFALPMLVVTHQIDDAAMLGDTLIALQGGRVIGCGALREVSATPAFQALLDARDVGAALPASVLNVAGGARSGSIWVRADHVLIATEAPRALSARNVWPGRVATLTREPTGAIRVQIETAAGAVLSRVTAGAARELGLTVGSPVWAIVKAHAL